MAILGKQMGSREGVGGSELALVLCLLEKAVSQPYLPLWVDLDLRRLSEVQRILKEPLVSLLLWKRCSKYSFYWGPR